MTLTTLLLLLIAAETTYLSYGSLRNGRTKIESSSILLDTSVLIDGRIEAIARSGLLTAPLVIPRSVVRELQYMADKSDHEKRERARYGLDMIEKLQSLETVRVTVIEDGPLTDGGVDEQLVSLAKSSGSRLCTTDYNLNKAARVQGVIVLNINEIAHALRIVRLPGEQVTIYLQQAGQERDQAVGHLDDGTMVVVDNGKSHIGESAKVEVTRALQTVAGKMLFAKLVTSEHTAKKSSRPERQGSPRPAPEPTRQPKPKVAEKTSRAPKPRQNVSASTSSAATPESTPDKPVNKQQSRRRPRKSMTARAEDSFVDLVNKQ